MSVLIVIPCLNEAAHLPALLDRLLADDPTATIVVADGGSTDRSRAIVRQVAARHPGVRLMANPARIQSAGVNLAVRRFGAGHRWLVRIDAHCGYPAGYVRGLVTAAVAHCAASVVVPMATAGHGGFQSAAAAAQNSRLGNGGAAHRTVAGGPLAGGGFVDHGHHALFDLALFARIGGYDETFSHNEDAELDKRLLAAGGRIWLEPTLAITYWPRRTPGALFRQYRGYGRGRAMTLARHAGPVRLRQLLPLAIAPLVALGLAGLGLAGVSPWAGLLAVPALVWVLLCLAYGLVLGLRDRSASAAAAGLAAMIMHFGWSLGFLAQRLFGGRPGAPPLPIALAGPGR